ncbi:ATP-binding protein [Enterococcus sp. AZ020]|uniref:ATP-binding protein n=2 Tax=unclassified Enterococcus TaxID=2608891 RepID=UPI003D2D8CC6
MKLQLKDLDFGKTDARNEYDFDKKFFLSSFYAPISFDYNDFLEGKKYFIVGGKGTGKTALLMYLHSLKKGNSRFILYKEDIDEEQKSDFLDLMNTDLKNFNNKEISALNFEKVWQLYLHKLVAEELSEKKFFVNNDFFKSIKKLLIKLIKNHYCLWIHFY